MDTGSLLLPMDNHFKNFVLGGGGRGRGGGLVIFLGIQNRGLEAHWAAYDSGNF